MDPLSITAATIGISDAAITSISRLRDLITGVENASDTAKDIAASLDGIKKPLDLLEELQISEASISIAAKEDLKRLNVAEVVNTCGKVCEHFSRSLERWTRHSDGFELSFRDRLSVAVVQKEKIRTFRTQVHACQDTVRFAIQATQLLSQLRSERLLEADRNRRESQLLALDLQVREHLESNRKKQVEAGEREHRLEMGREEQFDDDTNRDEVLDEIEKQSKFRAADQTSCEALRGQIRCMLVTQTIGKVVTSHNSVSRVGISQNAVGKVDQRIGDVTTDWNSASYVGIWGSISDDRFPQNPL